MRYATADSCLRAVYPRPRLHEGMRAIGFSQVVYEASYVRLRCAVRSRLLIACRGRNTRASVNVQAQSFARRGSSASTVRLAPAAPAAHCCRSLANSHPQHCAPSPKSFVLPAHKLDCYCLCAPCKYVRVCIAIPAGPCRAHRRISAVSECKAAKAAAEAGLPLRSPLSSTVPLNRLL